MLIRCGLLLLFLSCVKTNFDDDIGAGDYNRRFALWPSVHNGARLMRERREDTKTGPEGINEGDPHGAPSTSPTTTQVPQQAENNNHTNNGPLKNQATNQDSNIGPNNATNGLSNAQPGLTDGKSIPSVSKSRAADANLPDTTSGSNVAKSGLSDVKSGLSDDKSGSIDFRPGASNTTALSPNTVVSTSTVQPAVNATNNSTNVVKTGKDIVDLNDPGVVKRGLIVFGGFALLAVAYYVFYRRKGKNSPSGNTHSLTDTNQFRYGVLQSEDKRDTELSRVPLTMESDEDEEEDLEIFDLGQKKKSLSYVNLQTNDEDVVFSLNDQEEDDRGNLLLDIEDGPSDTLINWSSNGNNKSIL